jgi:hypothetical protein
LSVVFSKISGHGGFFVTAIPVKVLINKEGVIIGRWRGGGEEHMAEMKNMLQELFME